MRDEQNVVKLIELINKILDYCNNLRYEDFEKTICWLKPVYLI